MASRRSNRSGALGVGAEQAGGWPAPAGTPAPHRPLAANDNKAPLLLKLRRLVFGAMAALAVTWLFWVGLLR